MRLGRGGPSPSAARVVLWGSPETLPCQQRSKTDPLATVENRPPSGPPGRARYPEVTAPVHFIYGEKDWSRPSDRQANRRQLPNAEFTEVPNAGHFIALERPDVPANVLNAVA